MIQDFSKEELKQEETVRDTELTLGGGTLLVIGGGLVVLCVVFFGVGYAVGHRTSPGPSVSNVLPAPNARSSVVPVGSSSKPGAGQAQTQPQMQPSAEAPTDVSGDPTPVQALRAAADKGADSPQPQVKPAVDSQVRPTLTSQTGVVSSSAPLQVMPAMTNVQGWMVQIAAVSHPEDADVLVNALRRRGYTVTARRDNSDSLIHVQTGPFVNRNDANAMRQKLLNDGYNAIVQ